MTNFTGYYCESDIRYVRNKYYNAKSVRVDIDIDNVHISYHGTNELSLVFLPSEEDASMPIDIEQNLYYLSANRIGRSCIPKFRHSLKWA